MSENLRGVTDVPLTKEDVKTILTELYGPIVEENDSSVENVHYLYLNDKASDNLRCLQIGLNSVFANDFRDCDLPKDFSAMTSVNVPDIGSSYRIIDALLSAVGGYKVEEDDTITHVQKTYDILDTSDEGVLLRKAQTWVKNTLPGLNVPEDISDDITERLIDIYLDTKKHGTEPSAPSF